MVKETKIPTPPGQRVQLARLFGESSVAAKSERLTDAQWRKTLVKLLDHLYEYILANVRTDELHMLMLCSGLSAARQSLKDDEDFWPGYVEGITRIALLLMGDYPDHRSKRPGSRTKDHFDLKRFRSIQYSQDDDQRLWTLAGAYRLGLPGFERDPFIELGEFRSEKGPKATVQEFLDWYRRAHPENYARVF